MGVKGEKLPEVDADEKLKNWKQDGPTPVSLLQTPSA